MKFANNYAFVGGAIRAPLMLLLWSALVLFFGHQYQAFAILDSDMPPRIQAAEPVPVDPRVEQLLDEMLEQEPPAIPQLLDPQDFGLDLAAALSATELGQGRWQVRVPATNTAATDKASFTKGAKLSKQASQIAKVQERNMNQQPLASTKRKTVKNRRAAASAANTSSVTTQRAELGARFRETKKDPKNKAFSTPKFVRLPVRSPVASPILPVDPLRQLKDSARLALHRGSSARAYDLLRAQVVAGRADIEYLGLLALASLDQHPKEAEVLYQHLAKLQPDVKRWQRAIVLLQTPRANYRST